MAQEHVVKKKQSQELKQAPKKDHKQHESVQPAKAHKTKTVTIKHHHAKPYRKRHFIGFGVFLLAGLTLLGLAIRYDSKVQSALDTAKTFIADTFSPRPVVNQTIESSYGFSLTYDGGKFYATAVDSSTGDLFIGSELTIKRSYETVRIAPSLQDTNKENSNMTAHYYYKNDIADANNLSGAEAIAMKDFTSSANLQVKKTGSSNVTYGGKQFMKTEWVFQSGSKVLSGFTPSFTTYTTIVNGHPFAVQIVNSTISTQKANQYEEVLQSFYFGASKTTQATPSPAVEEKVARNKTLLDTVLLGGVASAETTGSALTSEKISSIYGPAVVKIFNVYCMDINIDGKPALKNLCNGSTGSGFFINEDGHIASNGHVVNSSMKDLTIQTAYALFARGNTTILDYLAEQVKLTPSEVPAGTPTERFDYIFNRLYEIDESRFTLTNSVVNLMVSLGKEQPDVTELVNDTTNRQKYAEQTTIKRASPVAQDYRGLDGIKKFYASDVAIIKIDGNNYPVTKLGTITGLLQGANLSILGYPGNASENGIVDAGESTVTLTSGKVSSTKNALGSDKKLIETDTTIGHGNSGGPAFNDSGEVVGISTYTAAKTGDGTYNYIRDIKDLVDLAAKSSVTISSTSETQKAWEKGLSLFNTAHYSKSIKSFEAVQKLYPSHPRVEEFIAAANQNIKDGKDVKDFPILIVAIGGSVLLGAAAVAAVIIIRHKRAHNVYKTHVGAGMMQPLPQGAAPQVVAYNPAHVAAQNNVLTMQQMPMQPVPMQQPVQQPMMQPQQPAAMPQQMPPQQPQMVIPGAQQPTVVAPNQPPQPPLQ